MTCASCAARIERGLNRLDGVEATVNYVTEKASVDYEPSALGRADLVATVERLGYGVPDGSAASPLAPASPPAEPAARPPASRACPSAASVNATPSRNPLPRDPAGPAPSPRPSRPTWWTCGTGWSRPSSSGCPSWPWR